MKTVCLACLVVATLLMSCNNSDNEEKTVSTTPTDTTKPSPVNCYQFANADDTLSLKLIHVGDSITGTLLYKLHEKDRNTGTIQGVMQGAVLLADYKFMSEGSWSVRQVAFKHMDSVLLEGYGEMEEVNGRQVFKTPGALQFNERFPLTEVNCR
jgi:hypothetical protein